MPSTYSSSLRLELQATGENSNTWGTKTNNNLNLIEQAVAGYVKITLVSASATYNLTIDNASASDGRNAFIEFAGTVASAISVVVPDVEKGYWVKNSATGSNLTFRTSSGTGFTLPQNDWVFVISDGASAFPVTTSLTNYARIDQPNIFTNANTFTSAITVTGPVSITGATVITSATDIRANLSVTGSTNLVGNVVVSGSTILASVVDIKGAASLASTLVANGNSTFNGNVSVSGTFLVSGVATLASAVDIKGATSLASTLVVGGNTTLNGSVSVSGSFAVSGASTFTSVVDIRAGLSVTGIANFTSVVNINTTGIVSVSVGALNILGGTTNFKSNVSVSGTLVVRGNVQLNAITSVSILSCNDTINSSLFITKSAGVSYSQLSGNTLALGTYSGSVVFITAPSSSVALSNFIRYTFTELTLSHENNSDIQVSGDIKIRASVSAVNFYVPARFAQLSDNPAGAVAGEVYYNTSANMLRCYNGTIWKDLF